MRGMQKVERGDGMENEEGGMQRAVSDDICETRPGLLRRSLSLSNAESVL